MIERQPPERSRRRPTRRQAAPAARAPRRHTAWIVLGGAGVWGALTVAGLGGLWTTVGVALGAGLLALANRPAPRRRQRPRRNQPAPRVASPSQEEPLFLNSLKEEYNTLPKPPKPVAPPLRAPSAPVRAVAPPVRVAPPQVQTAQPVRVAPPAQATPPVRVTPPVQAITSPVEAITLPVEAVTPSLEETTPPVEAVTPSLEETTPPAEAVTPSLEETTPPVEAVTPSLEETTPPAEAVTPSLEETTLPVEAVTPPVEAVAPPVEAATPPAEEDPNALPYRLPTAAMLPAPSRNATALSDDELIERGILLENTLRTFGVAARVIEISPGPAVTRYELQPAPGVRVNKFTQLTDDIALALAAEDIRIEAPIPGKSAVGIEVPNKVRQMVPLREVLESPAFKGNPSRLTVAFGKDNAGNAVVGDLAKMPHLLIAGSTGSGKSVCMNTIICSLLFKARPDEVKMLMIDPKMVELSTYNGIPHLTAPVVTDVRKAAGYLKGAVKEMEGRYELFAAAGVRNIDQYNRMVAANPGPDPEHPLRPLPFIVIFIDELADLMMVAPADVEDAICRLAQMARACGMHLVIATQSPRVDVITGLIKANVPSRIAFAVSSQIDSRVIMDSSGAERLLGRGDMLYHPSGLPKPVRAQGAFIDETSVDGLVRFVKEQGRPTFTAQEVAVDLEQKRGRGADDTAATSAADTAFPQAVRVVIEHGQASVSILQRRLRCNYSKAARLIDMMEERGYIGPHQGSKPRDVLIGMAQWAEEFGAEE